MVEEETLHETCVRKLTFLFILTIKQDETTDRRVACKLVQAQGAGVLQPRTLRVSCVDRALFGFDFGKSRQHQSIYLVVQEAIQTNVIEAEGGT